MAGYFFNKLDEPQAEDCIDALINSAYDNAQSRVDMILFQISQRRKIKEDAIEDIMKDQSYAESLILDSKVSAKSKDKASISPFLTCIMISSSVGCAICYLILP